MSDLKLDSLRIQNFRTFKDLTIDRLGRVNLIVGKNNVGKTSLLEAINLYVRGGTGDSLSDIVSSRQLEGLDKYRSTDRSDFGIDLPPARHLFYGRPDLSTVAPDDEDLGDLSDIRITSTPESNSSFVIELRFFPGKKLVDVGIHAGEGTGISSRVLGEKVRSVFLSARDVRAEADRHWRNIEATTEEDLVLHALSIIEERRVEDIGFTSLHFGDGEASKIEPFPIMRTKGNDRPEPLSNLGEGMNRAFALAIGLIRAKNGVLLVDEIENGLHYSVQPDLWQMIFETARELDVQVFATTHSFDCIKAFQQAAEKSEAEGRLISLRRSEREEEEGKIVAVPYDEDALESVAHSNIEVR